MGLVPTVAAAEQTCHIRPKPSVELCRSARAVVPYDEKEITAASRVDLAKLFRRQIAQRLSVATGCHNVECGCRIRGHVLRTVVCHIGDVDCPEGNIPCVGCAYTNVNDKRASKELALNPEQCAHMCSTTTEDCAPIPHTHPYPPTPTHAHPPTHTNSHPSNHPTNIHPTEKNRRLTDP